MKQSLILSILIFGLAACTPAQSSEALDVNPLQISTEPVSTSQAVSSPPVDSSEDLLDAFSFLPAPTCNGTLTPTQGEGPYYTPNTPERNSLLEEGMEGEMLILIGYVLDENCQPISGARLDFWQADTNGDYDNLGYTLRGNQYTDAQGRYYLETVLPGLYGSRPIEHIHVKVQAPNGEMLTSQLYFPNQPVENLTVSLQEQTGYWLGIFTFVIR
ncbi:MAG: intradiol ring-cleavage dioxygenase [Chloroflexi bacterium]|nr:intradiol ring-cleavage dioxygenase [Chloroflexota bacterium]